MTASQAPHWGLIIFMVVLFFFSFLLQLDPNITDNGGAVGISSITFPDLSGIFTFNLTATLSGLGTIPLFIVSIFVFFTGVVTFSNLGLPLIVQWAFAIPCILILIWTILAFTGALRNVVFGGS